MPTRMPARSGSRPCRPRDPDPHELRKRVHRRRTCRRTDSTAHPPRRSSRRRRSALGLFRSRRGTPTPSINGPRRPITLPPCNHASKPPLNPLTRPTTGRQRPRAAFVITGTCDSPTGPTTAATTGETPLPGRDLVLNTKSGRTTNDSGSNCALDTPIEEGATGTGPDVPHRRPTATPPNSAPTPKHRYSPASPNHPSTPTRLALPRGPTTAHHRRGLHRPRPHGRDSTGGSLTAAPPLPGTAAHRSAESPSRRSSPTAAGSDSVADGSLTAGSTASRSPADSLSASGPRSRRSHRRYRRGCGPAVGGWRPLADTVVAFRRSPATAMSLPTTGASISRSRSGRHCPGCASRGGGCIRARGSPACAPRDVDGSAPTCVARVGIRACRQTLTTSPTRCLMRLPMSDPPDTGETFKLPLAPMLMAFFDMVADLPVGALRRRSDHRLFRTAR